MCRRTLGLDAIREIHFTRVYSSEIHFLERAQIFQNLGRGQSLATEFSQTSRLAEIKIHIISPYETILMEIRPSEKKLWQLMLIKIINFRWHF